MHGQSNTQEITAVARTKQNEGEEENTGIRPAGREIWELTNKRKERKKERKKERQHVTVITTVDFALPPLNSAKT